MSLQYPLIATLQQNYAELDSCIEKIRLSVSVLDFIEVSYGRAYTHKIKGDNDKYIYVPLVYTKNKEYQNVLPNDFKKGQSFIVVKMPLKVDEFSKNGSTFLADISLIFWGNLMKLTSLNDTNDYVFTQELMQKTINIISKLPFVKEITNCYDENVKDIFNGYNINEENETLMYPFGGFRIDFKIGFMQQCFS